MNFTKFAEWSFGKRSNTPSRHSVFPNHKCRVIYPEFPSKSELHSAFLCTGREQITELFEIGNSLHDLLKFTYEISEQELSFLDVSIYKGKRFNTSNILDVKSYIKPTNTFQYLHRDSAHPESVFKGFIKGECIRHMRNTNDTLIYRKRLAHFQDKLIDSGYKACEIQPIIDEVRQSNRTEMLIQP